MPLRNMRLKKTFARFLNEAQQANTQQLPVKVFAQDESRLGLMTIIRRLITGKGVKPIASFQHTYKTLYLYGVVEPLTGEHFFFVFSHLDTVCFQAFIDQVAATFADTFNIMLLDRGTFHRAKALVLPPNMYLIFQPAATPELNPIERVWEYIKDRLAGKNFASLDELFHAASTILKGITQEILQSLTGCDYFTTAVKGVFI
jgi:hypothetical protein